MTIGAWMMTQNAWRKSKAYKQEVDQHEKDNKPRRELHYSKQRERQHTLSDATR